MTESPYHSERIHPVLLCILRVWLFVVTILKNLRAERCQDAAFLCLALPQNQSGRPANLQNRGRHQDQTVDERLHKRESADHPQACTLGTHSIGVPGRGSEVWQTFLAVTQEPSLFMRAVLLVLWEIWERRA